MDLMEGMIRTILKRGLSSFLIVVAVSYAARSWPGWVLLTLVVGLLIWTLLPIHTALDYRRRLKVWQAEQERQQPMVVHQPPPGAPPLAVPANAIIIPNGQPRPGQKTEPKKRRRHNREA